MPKCIDLTGRRFGMLTVIHKTTELEDRYAVWICQCDCGGTCRVNTKRLKRGTIANCGCIPKTTLQSGPVAADLSGMVFGNLTVLYRTKNRGDRVCWHCKCICGNETDVTAHELRAGKTKSCGCMSHANPYFKDLTGQRFGMLTVQTRLKERDYKGSIVWGCICDCGNEVVTSSGDLIEHKRISCGCYRKKILPQKMQEGLHRIDGTCLESLLRQKPRSDNASGHVGIHITKNGKYRAAIGFKGKRYNLGTYSNLQDAINARKRGEEIHISFLEQFKQSCNELEKS